jgi:hypothetical protein
MYIAGDNDFQLVAETGIVYLIYILFEIILPNFHFNLQIINGGARFKPIFRSISTSNNPTINAWHNMYVHGPNNHHTI